MRSILSILALVLASVLPGCLDADAPGEPLDAEPERPPDDVPGQGPFEAAFSGFLVYRHPAHRLWQGDDPGQCLWVPEGTQRIVGVLDWEPREQQMGLEFRHLSEGTHVKSWNGTTDLYHPPAITVQVESPPPGEWFMYAGPGIAGGGVSWSLALTLEGVPADHDLQARGC